MKRLGLIAGLVLMCVTAFGQNEQYSVRRVATVTTGTTFAVASFTARNIGPTVAYCAYAASTNGTVTFSARVNGYTHVLGAVTVTNNSVVQLPLIWLRPDQGDALLVSQSLGTNAPMSVAVDFRQ